MDNHGKGNIIYIILIPVLLIIALLIGDTIISYTQKRTYKEITENIVEEVLNNSEISRENLYNGIKRAYERRGYETDRLMVKTDETNENNIYLENEHSYFGLMNSFKKNGEEFEYSIFGIEYLTFKFRKNSKTFIKVNISYDENNELIFEYTE